MSVHNCRSPRCRRQEEDDELETKLNNNSSINTPSINNNNNNNQRRVLDKELGLANLDPDTPEVCPYLEEKTQQPEDQVTFEAIVRPQDLIKLRVNGVLHCYQINTLKSIVASQAVPREPMSRLPFNKAFIDFVRQHPAGRSSTEEAELSNWANIYKRMKSAYPSLLNKEFAPILIHKAAEKLQTADETIPQFPVRARGSDSDSDRSSKNKPLLLLLDVLKMLNFPVFQNLDDAQRYTRTSEAESSTNVPGLPIKGAFVWMIDLPSPELHYVFGSRLSTSEQLVYYEPTDQAWFWGSQEFKEYSSMQQMFLQHLSGLPALNLTHKLELRALREYLKLKRQQQEQ